VELGLWADLMIVAPASANTIAKMANGQSDNMLLATYLSARCPVLFAPAMDLDMWHHPSTQANISKLKSYGDQLIPVVFGELASGLVGEGRMAEPEDIVRHLEALFQKQLSFASKKVLITAGPTFEAIDPVRYIGNHSSGKMGICIAHEFAKRGAEVFLVLGPSSIPIENDAIKVHRVVSATDMYDACKTIIDQCDIIVLSAAVADYRPLNISNQKIKKSEDQFNIELTKTIDIASYIGKSKHDTQFLVGFALETENEEANAMAKIQKKNLDLIVLNSLNDKGAGFKFDTNKVTILSKNGERKTFELKSKEEVAKDIVNEIETRIGQ
jgi:phosphopantothenoylcysteine decarboxylase/phosphopantothenate--cysteine ligase